MTIKRHLIRILKNPRFFWIKRLAFFLRGVAFLGWRFRCPCCGWPLRGFLDRSGLWKVNPDGYCPRCNAKARHRRHALFLDSQQIPADAAVRVLEIGPWWALSRYLMDRCEHVGVDCASIGPHVRVQGDTTRLPFRDGVFEVALCFHVLEHVVEDRAALSELFRVVAGGGRVIVSVPIRLDRPTHEDPTITDPEERLRLFGERGHVRYYGNDLIDRLLEAGFEVTVDLAKEVPESFRVRHGLRQDENIFHCVKPLPGAHQANGRPVHRKALLASQPE